MQLRIILNYILPVSTNHVLKLHVITPRNYLKDNLNVYLSPISFKNMKQMTDRYFLKSFIVKMKSRINIMEYTCNLGLLEAEAGGLKKRLA